VFEIACVVLVWYAVGYLSAIMTVLALNGEVDKLDWRWAWLVALLGPIQTWVFFQQTEERV
jgi:hypothetical protein